MSLTRHSLCRLRAATDPSTFEGQQDAQGRIVVLARDLRELFADWERMDHRLRTLHERSAFPPVCRKCGVAYGWERIVPHVPGCPYDRQAGVLADDCDWPA